VCDTRVFPQSTVNALYQPNQRPVVFAEPSVSDENFTNAIRVARQFP
jgi:hypothetical protein